MATTKRWRKGRWDYTTAPKQYPTRVCDCCGEEIPTNNYTKHLNTHVKAGIVTKLVLLFIRGIGAGET